MIECAGITEITGRPGTGKTAIALDLCKNISTLYIATNILKHTQIPAEFVHKRFDNFYELYAFIKLRLPLLAKYSNMQAIIIDGLDTFLYTERHPRKFSDEICTIARILKDMCFMMNIKVIVVNNTYTEWAVDHYVVNNKYLGLRWCYTVNTKYILERHGAVRQILKISENKPVRTVQFKIYANGIEYEHIEI
ncbi:hypothetical protein ENBRE01_2134 [Enteropsectra breve]|nr:hypothetical protein ENBRE01_2134 [Enteropsectra breve]